MLDPSLTLSAQWNNCKPNFNYTNNSNNNNNNWQFGHSHRNNSEFFIERIARLNPSSYTYQQEQRWSKRDYQDRNKRSSSRLSTSRAEPRRDGTKTQRKGAENERGDKEYREGKEKPKCKNPTTNPKEVKVEEENRTKIKAADQVVDEVIPKKRPTSCTSADRRSTTLSTPPKSLEGEKGKLPVRPSEVKETEADISLPPGNPQIKVRPFTELLKQEIIAVTQEQRAAEAAAPSFNGIAKLDTRSATRLRRSTVSSSHGNETSITERLASMDKESLKYIINNSDTIYNDHLKQQARRRLREEIRRQLREIELEQPKDKPATDLVEDEIVDSIKLPQILLQEIEKCFGLELSENVEGQGLQVKQEQQEEQQDQQEELQQEQEKQPEQPVEQQQEELGVLLQVKQELVEQLLPSSLNQLQSNQEQQQEKEHQQVELQLIPNSSVEEAPMPKKSSTGLMTRFKLVEQNKAMAGEESSKNGTLTPSTQKQNVETRKRNLQEKNVEQVAVKDETALMCIKKEIIKDDSPITYIVLSSSEDEDDVIEVQGQKQRGKKKQVPAEQQLEKKALERDAIAVSDDSNCSQVSNASSSKRRYQLRLQANANNVVDSFEKLILPQLKESLAESYRSSHCSSLQSRLLFISCVVTSEHNTQQIFSKTEVAKMQQNLKSSDNRLGIEFLLRQIVNVVNHFKQAARQKQQAERMQKKAPYTAAAVDEPNELNLAQSAELAESVEPHQSEISSAEQVGKSARASLPPTPPRNDTPINIRNSATGASLPTLSLGIPYLPLDAAALPHLSPDSVESLLVSGHSVAHNLHEIDRRLLENQNRRKFLEEMIMKFQKEKSDMEMLSLELQNMKFLLLNAVIGRNQATAAASTTSPVVNTPTNSPPPAAPSTKVAEVAEVPSRPPKRKLRRKRILPRRKPPKTRKPRNPPFVQPADTAESKSSQTDETLVLSGSSSTSIPHLIKEEPPEPSAVENVDINKRTANAATDSVASTCGKRLRLTKCATANAAIQQPLAVIPPLPPPPPPPEPFANMSLPSATPQPMPTQASAECSDYGFIPSGRLHSITSPITQIRVHKVSIIAASENGDIYVFNIGNHKLELQIAKHSEAITNMYLCDRDSFLYTTSLDGFLKKSSLEVGSLSPPLSFFCAVSQPLDHISIFFAEPGARHADRLPKGTTAIHRYRLEYCIYRQSLGQCLHL